MHFSFQLKLEEPWSEIYVLTDQPNAPASRYLKSSNLFCETIKAATNHTLSRVACYRYLHSLSLANISSVNNSSMHMVRITGTGFNLYFFFFFSSLPKLLSHLALFKSGACHFLPLSAFFTKQIHRKPTVLLYSLRLQPWYGSMKRGSNSTKIT